MAVELINFPLDACENIIDFEPISPIHNRPSMAVELPEEPQLMAMPSIGKLLRAAELPATGKIRWLMRR